MKQSNCLLCLIGVLLLICMFVPYETFTCQKYSTFADDTYNSLITKDMYKTIYSDSTSSSFWDNYDERITPSFGFDVPIETNTDSLQYNCVPKEGDYEGEVRIDSDRYRIAPLTEDKCVEYKNLGWCIEQGRTNGTCINEIVRPAKCVCGWNTGCNEEGEVDGMCTSGNKRRIKQKYEYYDECKKCKKKGKCLVKVANSGYDCYDCTEKGIWDNTEDYCEKNYGCWDKDTPNKPRKPEDEDGPSNCNSFNIPKSGGYNYITL